jgi:hypothetical protein
MIPILELIVAVLAVPGYFLGIWINKYQACWRKGHQWEPGFRENHEDTGAPPIHFKRCRQCSKEEDL